MLRFALAASALLLLLAAAPASALPAPSPPPCTGMGGAFVFSAVWVCRVDGDADGAPDGLAYGVFAGAVVPVVVVAAFALAGTDGDITDQSGDGVPETAALRPAWWAVGYATITFCGEPPQLFCWTLHCIACDELTLRAQDADHDGVPDTVAYDAPVDRPSLGAVDLPWVRP
ncbi:MAG TPA: hypothetical protein VGR28_05170 [Candidatus Thermoplasmatota archaeon]|jgi:hypothetical protein|nr:hypothetical protein [Candidatus Thermoplasmatota archaeon]